MAEADRGWLVNRLCEWYVRAWDGRLIGRVICPRSLSQFGVRARLLADGWPERTTVDMSQYVCNATAEQWPTFGGGS